MVLRHGTGIVLHSMMPDILCLAACASPYLPLADLLCLWQQHAFSCDMLQAGLLGKGRTGTGQFWCGYDCDLSKPQAFVRGLGHLPA